MESMLVPVPQEPQAGTVPVLQSSQLAATDQEEGLAPTLQNIVATTSIGAGPFTAPSFPPLPARAGRRAPRSRAVALTAACPSTPSLSPAQV